jgi:hypothetical protein
VVHDSLEVSAASASYVGVCGACSCIVLGNCISVVCPSVLKADDEHVGRLTPMCCFHDGLAPDYGGKVQSATRKDGPQDLISQLTLDQISSIEAIQAICAENPFLERKGCALCRIFTVVSKIFVDGRHFGDEVVGPLELLSLAGEVEIIKLIFQRG